MTTSTDVRVESIDVTFIPVAMRVPLKFGPESVSSVNCIRVAATVSDRQGRTAVGWGETPLSVTWAWPSLDLSYSQRYEAMVEFCGRIGDAWRQNPTTGHPIEIGHVFLTEMLPSLLREFNRSRGDQGMPQLAALIAASTFDIATHDAFGMLHDVDIYQTYNDDFMSHDLTRYLVADDDGISYAGKFPSDYFAAQVPSRLPVWHLVGGLDPLEDCDRSGDEPNDDYPVILRDWIARDGLQCLKVKLRGTDDHWDYERLIRVGRMSIETGVTALSADFNCTVTDPDYVNAILDRLRAEHFGIYQRILYVEQPFPYDLEQNQIDVSSVSRASRCFWTKVLTTGNSSHSVAN